jgi:hypothetical protein
MISKEEIERAIGDHALWKARFKSVLETKVPMTSIDSAAKDDRCDFGDWLHGAALSSEEKSSLRFLNVDRLHSEFHLEAAQFLALAVADNHQEALASIAPGGMFHEASAKLISAMLEWHKSLE